MRADGKPEGLRQAMAWLHTWSGLLLGWLLFAIFFTGTLSYLRSEIDDWMRPELHRSSPATPAAQVAGQALQTLAQLAPQASSWSIALPGARQTAVTIQWRDAASGPGQGRAGLHTRQLDAASGAPITARQTRGGNFLYRFHFELYGLPRSWARWPAGIAAMAMLVAIVSGVITHKKIFSDFFTFRPGKGQRSWLDAHNATAVLALPFHLMIALSGLLLLMNLLMPWPQQAVYQGDSRAYFADLIGTAAARGAGRGMGGAGSASSDAANAAAEPQQAAAAHAAALPAMLAQAQAQWPVHGVGRITISAPRSADAVVELREGGGQHLSDQGSARVLRFSAASGAALQSPPAAAPSWVRASYNILVAPHMGRFAEPAVRWLLLLSGLMGCFMIGSGLVLWVVKRLPQRAKLGRTPWGHRLVEALNVGAIAGLLLATASYWWLNRLLPAHWADRALWEIRGFLLVWLLCALHAGLRQHRRAWLEQMAAATVLLGLLPVLNALSGGAALWSAWASGQWGLVGFEVFALLLAGCCGSIWFWLGRRQASAKQPARHKKPDAGVARAVAGSGGTVGTGGPAAEPALALQEPAP
ncbi:hypothetical protein CK623_01070 [Vandammella animalimorsus]|uniref:Iron-regulated membrane protein n=1 Tax=Vandammella animalimorsus TaxID=2029117 RepID=A0A2A2ASJ9_9BURK|nr:PepSY-associated TM helix domain-containing protein [Vandammella animalimorsus]PAT41550.1 hypothetical protein CK623_01070 [Vandammella animalimorsus]